MSAVLQSPSAKGKWRAFSTCGSHLTVVAIFYGTLTWVYFRPLTSYSVAGGRILTVMYTVVTPMLNPFIYSLRNKDVKGAQSSPWVARESWGLRASHRRAEETSPRPEQRAPGKCSVPRPGGLCVAIALRDPRRPIFPSGCKGKLGVARESPQGRRDLT